MKCSGILQSGIELHLDPEVSGLHLPIKIRNKSNSDGSG